MISEAEAIALALHHSLASARTSFLAIREGPASEPIDRAAARRVIPQFGTLRHPPARVVEERRGAIPRVIWWSKRGGLFLMSEVPLYGRMGYGVYGKWYGRGIVHHSLASARTSFLAIREGPASEPVAAAAKRIVPQFGTFFFSFSLTLKPFSVTPKPV